MSDFLTKIIESKKKDLIKLKKLEPERNIRKNALKIKYKSKFKSAFSAKAINPSIIAEIKLASPTIKSLGSKKDILKRAVEYEKAKADVISVITEKHFFKGDVNFISQIKKKVNLPILQKDFVIDPYQIYQAKLINSDAILLIARIIDGKKLKHFVNLTKRIGVEPVVEINDEKDLQKAILTKTSFIAVNARDLNTFKINMVKACNLMKKISNSFIKLGFSGVNSSTEVKKYTDAGAAGVLVGIRLMNSGNIAKYIKDLKDTNVKVKICGIRSKKSALAAVNSGADYLGFNFIAKSKRYIDPSLAKEITALVKGKIKTVGVIQDVTADYINSLVQLLDLDYVQLDDTVNEEFIKQIKAKIIQVVPLPSKTDVNKLVKRLDSYQASYFLIDREKQGQGKVVDTEKALFVSERFPVFFAGGLTPYNVSEIIKKVKPFAVDVASGIETNGVEDINKIKEFINNAKGVSI